MKKKINSKKGIVFWIEGFSGSGKSTISKLIADRLTKKYGKTLLLSGDVLRKFFNKTGYSKKDRTNNSYKFSELLKYLTDQKINVIYSVVCLNKAARSIYKKKIENLIIIYLKSDICKIIKLKKKTKTYSNNNNILGIDIKPEYPKKPNIIIENDFTKNSLNNLSLELINKLKKIL